MKNFIKILSVFFVMICGCERHHTAPDGPRSQAKTRKHATEYLQKAINSRGSLVFGSRRGDLKGQDSDTTIELKKDGSVVVIEYKISVLDYYGNYTIGNGGEIVVILKDYPDKWPDMVAALDEDSLLLLRKDGLTATSKEAQQYEEFANFWPFSLLNKKP